MSDASNLAPTACDYEDMANSTADLKCSRCSGERVDVRIAGGLGELVAARFDRSDRRGQRDGTVGLTGVACTSCGHVDLYATEPDRLLSPRSDA